MIGSMLSGLYNPNNTVSAVCESTHYTWQAFETLGICASCEDIPDSLERNCSYHDIDFGSSSYHYVYYDAHASAKCVYTTPDGAALEAHCGGYEGLSDLTQWKSSTTVRVLPPHLVTVSAITFSEDIGTFGASCRDRENWRVSRPTATQCTLRWCAKT